MSKGGPIEQSSKKPVPRFRQVVNVPKPVRRDPRFDHLSGSFNQGLFDQNYGFIHDLKSKEIHQMKQELALKPQDHTLAKTIQTLDNQERARLDLVQRQKLKREHRKQEAEKVKLGKKPYFLKQKEMNKLFMISKLVNKSDKELDLVTERKRKRDAGKDWKRVPKSRRTG